MVAFWVAGLACGSPNSPGGVTPELDPQFGTAVALPGKTYEIYWLGEEFGAGGVTWSGPDVASIGHEADIDGLEMGYHAGIPGSGVNFFITGGARCAAARASFEEQVRQASFEQDVMAAGVKGTLIEVPQGTRPINYIGAFFEREGTCIRIRAGSVGSLTPGGPDGNPALDRSIFLEVLENLRPYPQ